MQLTLSEQARIKQIRSMLDERDHDRIASEVERLERIHANPLTALLFNFEPDEHTKEAAEYLTEIDADFQDELAVMFGRLLEKRVEAEYVMSVYLSTLAHREVA